MTKVGVLISGRGSNLVALLAEMRAGRVPAEVALVVSNRAHAPGLDKARSFGAAVRVIEASPSMSREQHDEALSAALEAAGVQLICLAGYMRILSTPFVEKYLGRMLNIHPSLLPAFPGLHPQRQALAAGVTIAGCTVHFVTPTVDAGPIVAQAAVPVLAGDDEASLATRILIQEHRLYPRAVDAICRGTVRWENGRVIRDGSVLEMPGSLLS